MTVYSFADLAAFFKIKPKKNRKPKTASYTCPHCKKELLHIENTNVYICKNVVKKKNGVTEECGFKKIAF